MEHLVIHFWHDIRDITPYCEFVEGIRPALERDALGEYLGDDMAIDGGDAEAVFACASARRLFEFLRERLVELPFMHGAKVTLIFGEIDTSAPQEEYFL
jgi:hypothetical protein